jgi:hypothetical protein
VAFLIIDLIVVFLTLLHRAFYIASGIWEQWDATFSPEPRAFHSATLFGERLHIFGGCNLANHALDSLFKIDVSKSCYIKMLPPDALMHLFTFVDPPDLLSLAQGIMWFAFV